MKISKIKIHNFRSIKDQEININNYNLIVGENNSGKSNVINAMRYFYDDLKIGYDDFFQKRIDNELFVEITFDLSKDKTSYNFFKNDKGKKYLLDNNTIVVKKSSTFTTEAIKESGRHGLLNENSKFDNDNKFFGFTSVSKYMLGDLIYIPPIKDIKDEIKTTSKYTTIMKIVNKIISPKIEKDDTLKNINKNIQSFNKTDIFEKIEKDLTTLMSSYGCGIQLEFTPIEVDKIISSVTIQILEEGLEKLPVEFKGTGLQRALLINLLRYWAKEEKKSRKTNNTIPPTILLFEEPEIFQHPQKQSMIFSELQDIANGETQIIIASHSSNFVTEEDDELRNIIKTIKEKQETRFFQVSNQTIKKSLNSQRFKFWKYLDAEKKQLFFSDKVILCEGNTEKLVSKYCLKNLLYPSNYSKQTQVTIIDCCGKFQISHFIRLCNDLKIKYFLFYDKDLHVISGNKDHDLYKQNQEIFAETNSTLSPYSYVSDNDLETSLFGKPVEESKDKMIIIEKINNGEHDTSVLNKIKNNIKNFVEL